MRTAVALAVLVAACGDPAPFTLKFRVTDGDVQACTTTAGTKATSCSDVTMLCNGVASIRVFAPGDPTAPFISVCKELASAGPSKNLCSIGGIDLPLPTMPVKEQTLEVDMLVYPIQAVDPMNTGVYNCPANVAFGADGFPAPIQCTDPEDPTCIPPAIGGRAFYHPGDPETVVSLGCTNLAALEDPVCANMPKLAVTSGVNDFDTGVSVSSSTADSLLVSVGEPTFDSSLMAYKLTSTETKALALQSGPVPSWSGNVDLQLTSSACIEVFEDGAQTTAAVSCTNQITPVGGTLDLPGVRLAKPTLDGILRAINPTTPQFPLDGLVVGLALDYLGNPYAGVTIVPSVPMGNAAAHIQYMSADGNNFGATSTTSKGIWISTDAPYGTSFRPFGLTMANDGFGGLVAGKVDVVIIQFKPPNTGG
jgi:hypothetical protein